MKVIVTGSSGLIGSVLIPVLAARGHEVIALHHSTLLTVRSPKVRTLALDLTSPEHIERLVLDEFPDAIINCAAYASQDAVSRDEAAAEKINVALPRQLAMLARHVSARFLHLSTDMVFDGAQEQPYRSTDKPNPLNLYGQMKLLAEREVLRYAAEVCVVLRITLVTGNSPQGNRSVHEKIIAALAAGQPRVKLLTNEFRQPVSSSSVADILAELLERPSLSGLFHWSGTDSHLSRYEIGRQMLAHFGLSEKWLEAAEGSDPTRAPDLALELAPLVGKVKSRPESFEQQLDYLYLPEPLRRWAEANADLSAGSVSGGSSSAGCACADKNASGAASCAQRQSGAEAARPARSEAKIERFVEGKDF